MCVCDLGGKYNPLDGIQRERESKRERQKDETRNETKFPLLLSKAECQNAGIGIIVVRVCIKPEVRNHKWFDDKNIYLKL